MRSDILAESSNRWAASFIHGLRPEGAGMSWAMRAAISSLVASGRYVSLFRRGGDWSVIVGDQYDCRERLSTVHTTGGPIQNMLLKLLATIGDDLLENIL
jgi:hypothetical protein